MAYSLRRRDAQRGSIVLAAWQTTRGDVRETTDATGDTGDGRGAAASETGPPVPGPGTAIGEPRACSHVRAGRSDDAESDRDLGQTAPADAPSGRRREQPSPSRDDNNVRTLGLRLRSLLVPVV